MGIGAREGLGWTGTMDLTISRCKFSFQEKNQDAPAKERSIATTWNLTDSLQNNPQNYDSDDSFYLLNIPDVLGVELGFTEMISFNPGH